ncbi:hypothetical protein PBCVNEJV1_384R [Paramecium bursaria Chlorella virus NE-JV-1]|nr:hypothetical protein PBCVNEJV1_384R [Paramecium bursaria Chlorella virus NE-JV-1]
MCACGKQASFNLLGLPPMFCATCKTDEMVNVRSFMCTCGKQPSFNLLGLPAMFCATCKTDEMVDVKHDMCACGNRPSFNLSGLSAMFCATCKTDEMVDVIHDMCACGTRASFNLLGLPPRFCAGCKTSEMVDVIHDKCQGYGGTPCLVGYRLAPGCDYCLSCDPDDSRRDKFKKYENAFFRYVDTLVDIERREFIVRYDPEETSKKWARLDGVVFGGGIIVCLEVDENAHEEYACDESRMHMVTAELLQKYPGNEVCWIRVNPTTKHKNPWGNAAKRVRHMRFDDVVLTVQDVLENKTTDVVYIGFE